MRFDQQKYQFFKYVFTELLLLLLLPDIVFLAYVQTYDFTQNCGITHLTYTQIVLYVVIDSYSAFKCLKTFCV